MKTREARKTNQVKKFAEWIGKQDNTTWARPVKVTIGEKAYCGALVRKDVERGYWDGAHYSHGRSPFELRPVYQLWLLGPYPRKTVGTIFVFQHNHEQDPYKPGVGEWEISTFEYKTPFGTVFKVSELTELFYEKIHNEPFSRNNDIEYKKVPMTVEYLD